MRSDVAQPDRHVKSRTCANRRIGIIRFVLGQAQMGCAVVAGVLLVQTGVSLSTLVATGVATSLTIASVVLFRLLPRWRRER